MKCEAARAKKQNEDMAQRWRGLCEAFAELFPESTWKIVNLSPRVCFRTRLVLFSDLSQFENEEMADMLKKACKEYFEADTKISFETYPADFTRPDDWLVSNYALIKAKVTGFYPNARIVLTSSGNARCRNSLDYKKGQAVWLKPTVYNGKSWLKVEK